MVFKIILKSSNIPFSTIYASCEHFGAKISKLCLQGTSESKQKIHLFLKYWHDLWVYIYIFLSTCERKHCTSQNGKNPLVSRTSILRRVSRGETQHNSAVQHPDAGGVVRGSDTSPHEHTERRRRRVSESSERQTHTQTDVSSPTVVASYAYHVFVVVRETDVGHVGRVTEVTLVFGLLRN